VHGTQCYSAFEVAQSWTAFCNQNWTGTKTIHSFCIRKVFIVFLQKIAIAAISSVCVDSDELAKKVQ